MYVYNLPKCSIYDLFHIWCIFSGQFIWYSLLELGWTSILPSDLPYWFVASVRLKHFCIFWSLETWWWNVCSLWRLIEYRKLTVIWKFYTEGTNEWQKNICTSHYPIPRIWYNMRPTESNLILSILSKCHSWNQNSLNQATFFQCVVTDP